MTTNDPPPEPRFAATVVLLRDGADGLEVLMLRRHTAIEFAGDAWVFPGGRVEDADRALPPGCWRGIEPVALAPRFDTPADLVLGFHVAAVRETFEEAGLLLGAPASGRALDGPGTAVDGTGAVAARDGTPGGFREWLEAEGLVLDLGELAYLSRWVTPPVYKKRFDAVFFLAPAPAGQVAAHDQAEMTAGRWIRPPAALAAQEAGELSMMRPTQRTLRWLSDHESAAAAIAAARAQPQVPLIQPKAVRGPDGAVRVVDSGEPGDREASG